MVASADPRRTDPAFVAHVRRLYERDGLSTRRIADVLGVGKRAVDAALRSAGVTVAPRGRGRARLSARYPDPEDLAERLHELYQVERMTRRQASEKLGLTEGLVRTRLAEFGIPTRTRGPDNREDRREVPVERVLALYRDGGLSADEAADLLGVTRRILLRTAHDHGIPVRPGAPTANVANPIELIAALYADPLVRATLRRHRVPMVPAGGPIWQRFPEPVPLSAQLCTDLYVECGTSITQIELLTGQPASQVRRRLQEAGVQMRPAGGRCPFRRRWEQTQVQTSTEGAGP